MKCIGIVLGFVALCLFLGWLFKWTGALAFGIGLGALYVLPAVLGKWCPFGNGIGFLVMKRDGVTGKRLLRTGRKVGEYVHGVWFLATVALVALTIYAGHHYDVSFVFWLGIGMAFPHTNAILFGEMCTFPNALTTIWLWRRGLYYAELEGGGTVGERLKAWYDKKDEDD